MIQTIHADPSDAFILKISADITSVDSSVVCDAEQQAILAQIVIDLQNAIEKIKTALSQAQEDLDGRKENSDLIFT